MLHKWVCNHPINITIEKCTWVSNRNKFFILFSLTQFTFSMSFTSFTRTQQNLKLLTLQNYTAGLWLKETSTEIANSCSIFSYSYTNWSIYYKTSYPNLLWVPLQKERQDRKNQPNREINTRQTDKLIK